MNTINIITSSFAHSSILSFNAIKRARSYSTGSSVKPVKKYANADRDKLQILKDNKGKAGVYC